MVPALITDPGTTRLSARFPAGWSAGIGPQQRGFRLGRWGSRRHGSRMLPPLQCGERRAEVPAGSPSLPVPRPALLPDGLSWEPTAPPGPRATGCRLMEAEPRGRTACRQVWTAPPVSAGARAGLAPGCPASSDLLGPFLTQRGGRGGVRGREAGVGGRPGRPVSSPRLPLAVRLGQGPRALAFRPGAVSPARSRAARVCAQDAPECSVGLLRLKHAPELVSRLFSSPAPPFPQLPARTLHRCDKTVATSEKTRGPGVPACPAVLGSLWISVLSRTPIPGDHGDDSWRSHSRPWEH